MKFEKDSWQWLFFKDFWSFVQEHYEDWKIFRDIGSKAEKELSERFYREIHELTNKYNEDVLVTSMLNGFVHYLDERIKKGE